MSLEYIASASPARRRLIESEAGDDDTRICAPAQSDRTNAAFASSWNEFSVRAAGAAITYGVSLSPFEGYAVADPQAESFLRGRTELLALLPAIRSELQRFFPLAKLRLEWDEAREVGEQSHVVIVCNTNLDALSAFDAHRAFLDSYWLRLNSVQRAQLGFHVEFAAE